MQKPANETFAPFSGNRPAGRPERICIFSPKRPWWGDMNIALKAALPGLLLTAWLGTGCTTQHQHQLTSPYHPGPAAGHAVGTGVGVVAGNAAGAVVGFGEGAVSGAAAPFNNTSRVVRQWHTEVTPDGRTVQVPVDVLVDEYGRPYYTNKPAKK